MAALATTSTVLAAAVTNTGTLTVSYPTGSSQASLIGSTGGRAVINNNDAYPQAASGAGTVAFTFGSSNITVTNNSGVTWPVGAALIVSFGDTTEDGSYNQEMRLPGPVALTAASGTTGNTVADVGASFSQTTLNNNFKVLADKVNEILTTMRNSGAIVK